MDVNQDNVQLWHRDMVKENVLASQVALTSDYIFDIIPGSHAVSWRKVDRDINDENNPMMWEEFPEKYFDDGVRLVLDHGDVVVLHARLLHRGAPSQDKVSHTLPITQDVTLLDINKLATHSFLVLGARQNKTKSSWEFNDAKDGPLVCKMSGDQTKVCAIWHLDNSAVLCPQSA
eukprot:SAG31_NODE_13815_length_844_cov_1.830872_1_plen_174_part_10